MVKRLFDELNAQMLRAERMTQKATDAKDLEGNIVDNPDAREKRARILGRLQQSLDRLTKMEMERAALRKSKSARKPSDIRARLAQQLAAIPEPGTEESVSGESR